MNLADLNHLLSPLNEHERVRLPAIIRRLMASEDFQILFRHMNQSCDVFSSPFATDSDPIKAAARDGSKAHVRFILDIFIQTHSKPVERPTEQDTTQQPQ